MQRQTPIIQLHSQAQRSLHETEHRRVATAIYLYSIAEVSIAVIVAIANVINCIIYLAIFCDFYHGLVLFHHLVALLH